MTLAVACLLSCSSEPQAGPDASTGRESEERLTSSSATSNTSSSSTSSTGPDPSTSSTGGDSTTSTTSLPSSGDPGTTAEEGTTTGLDVEICNAEVGLFAPLPECSRDEPCTHVAAELGGDPIVTRSDPPACADERWTESPRQWQVGDVDRYACVFAPPNAAIGGRPLVVFLHPGGEGAASVDGTALLDKAADYDLSGSADRPGFVLAAVQGRNLHFPTAGPRDGRHHDFYHRDLASPSGNPDVAALDALLDDLMDEGAIDPDRIYVVGWSNGAFFGQLYAIARHEVATPGGNHVAAAAVFAAANPFDDIQRDPFAGRPHRGRSCKLGELPESDVPILLTYRSCDFATPCGSGGASCFGNEPGFVTSEWRTEAQTSLPGLTGRLIGGIETGAFADAPVGQCSAVAKNCDDPPDPEHPCAMNESGASCVCLLNHFRWPDGAYGQGSGIDNEPDMLDFLRVNARVP